MLLVPTCLIIHENRKFNVSVVTLYLDAPSNRIFLAMFSVSETPEDAIQFSRALSFQISSPWFFSHLYLNSLAYTRAACYNYLDVFYLFIFCFVFVCLFVFFFHFEPKLKVFQKVLNNGPSIICNWHLCGED